MAMEPKEAGRAEGEGEAVQPEDAAQPGEAPQPAAQDQAPETLFPGREHTPTPANQSAEDAEWSELLETARAKAEADDPPPGGVPNVRDTMLERGDQAPGDDELPGGQPPLPNSAVVDALADEIMPVLERSRPGGARKAWAIVGIVVLAVGFAASAWYALRPQAPMMADARPPLFKADPVPIKVKPAEPGGLKVPNQDKLVYERLTDKKPAAKATKMAPPPEKPVKKPKAVAPAKAKTAPAKAKTAPAKLKTVKAAPKASPPVKKAPVKTAALTPAKTTAKAVSKPTADKAAALKALAAKPKMERLMPAVPKVESVPKPAAPPPAKAGKAAAKAAPAPKTESAAKTPPPVKTASVDKAEPAAKAAAAATATDKVYRVQLLSALNEAGARAEYLRLKKKYASLLGDQPMDLQSAQIKGKGTYYRVRVGAFGSAKAARGLCAALSKAGQGCLLARP